ncbi:hypothetical protein SARC_11829 [Sphaeroforma arctica JP610]|uniref:Uncharacterized protein n=1 Tax=Sphaeroforma arctica JP610 TaxID=667725 RepID=A0A0L0FGS0_9EUKA|nr:hypothetical protein SARC_11829 [Sphaeroforma arctica JP610]KNC75651.1 hypothetical protein SARC_11829 [Sphaeroforma arctica JP610]|eukprot:XP_014149553.1 hypothetical protein SARC_11829 [Sphaeroforma arctica JP610]
MRTTSLKVETHDAVNNVTDLLIQHCEELFMVPTTTLERINGAVSTHNQTELKHTATLSQAQGV